MHAPVNTNSSVVPDWQPGMLVRHESEVVIQHKFTTLRFEEVNMIKNPRTRRSVSMALMIVGGVLIFLAPEDIWIGVLLLGFGISLELAGTLMKKKPEDH